MQFQKNKLDISERSNKIRDNSNSNSGEMPYMEPIGSQMISPISNEAERSLDLVGRAQNRERISPNPLTENNPNIFNRVKNDIKAKVDIDQLDEEKPIRSIMVNIPYEGINIRRNRSPQIINIRNSSGRKSENIYNIKTLGQNRKIKNNNYQTSTNPQMIDSHNFNSSNDSGQYQQILFDQKRLNENYINFANDRRERGGIIPLNNMSPNLNNFEDMNSSDQKFDTTNNNYNYRSMNGSNSQPNISVVVPSRNNDAKLNINNKNNNLQYIPNTNFNDEIKNKYINKQNQNLSYNDVKKIMRQFTKIYDPLKNNNGMLIESSQVVVPGASDDIFQNRYKVLSKMNRLSNILLSKRKKSVNKYQENSNLNKRSRSKTKSRSPLSIKSTERSRSGSPFMRKMPHNKFLFVSLAMISSKGPNAEDRIILRKMRLDKGGVVDLAQEERKRGKYKIKKISKNKNNINIYQTNPKYREIAAKIIQEWWKELKVAMSKKLKKIILIQSVFRGRWVRKNMYDL